MREAVWLLVIAGLWLAVLVMVPVVYALWTLS